MSPLFIYCTIVITAVKHYIIHPLQMTRRQEKATFLSLSRVYPVDTI